MPDSPLVEMLDRCRKQFRFYGDNHRDKYPPQHEKASVNYALAADIDDVIEAHMKLSGNLTPNTGDNTLTHADKA